MIPCIVGGVKLFDKLTTAEIFAAGIFMDDFSYCMDNHFEEFEDSFETYSTLTGTQENIFILPGLDNNIKALVR